MEEQLVLGRHELADWFQLGGVVAGEGAAGGRQRDRCRLAIARPGQLDPVEGEQAVVVGAGKRGKEVDQPAVGRRSQVANHRGIRRQQFVATIGIRTGGCRQKRHRGDEHQPGGLRGLVVVGWGRSCEIVAEPRELLAKGGNALGAGIRLIAAVGDKDNGRLQIAHKLDHSPIAFCRAVKNTPRLCPDRVAIPAEVAKLERGLRVACRQGCFDEAELALPLDEAFAEKHDAITVD